MEKRPVIKKNELAILFFLLLGLIFLFLLSFSRHTSHGIALLSIDGKNVDQIDLSQDGQWEIDLKELYDVPIILEVKDHTIRFKRSQCPDHLCERYGFISKEGQTAVCMPNRTVITIHSQADGALLAPK